LLAWLLGWRSAPSARQTEGPYWAAAAEVFISTSAAGGIYHFGAAAAAASAGNVTAGECNG
jgi:hypothetical protein